jgi:hypothetical protein
MKLVLLATIPQELWSEEFRTKGIKGVSGISNLYAQAKAPPNSEGTLCGEDVKDAILCLTIPFWIGGEENAEGVRESHEIVIQFAKEVKDIYVDFGDYPEAVEMKLIGEEDETYERMNIEECVRRGCSLYCAWVKEIKPEEILGIFHQHYKENKEEECFWTIEEEDHNKWFEKQPRMVK